MTTSSGEGHSQRAFAEPRKSPSRVRSRRKGACGSEEDVDRLVRENLGWLRSWLRGRVSDPELVHDVCQESLLKAVRSLRRLKDPSRFPAWLYRIAQNTLRDHLRTMVRTRRLFGGTVELDRLEGSPGPAERLGEREEAEALFAAIRSLPARYREPLLLRHARDLSYAEIGTILGISENAVQVRIFRARKMLQKRAGSLRDG